MANTITITCLCGFHGEADVGLDSEGAVVYIGNCPGCGKDLSSVKVFDEHKGR